MTLATSSGEAMRPSGAVRVASLDERVAVGPERVGVDRAGGDAHGADPVAAPLDREPAREVLERRARGRCVDHEWDPPPGAEPDEDHEPAVARDHRSLGDRPREVPHRIHVQPVHRSPALGRDGLGRRDELPAGVVDEHVDPAEPLEHTIDERRDVVGLAHVGAGDGQDLGARGPELRRNLLERLRSACGDRDERSGARVLACDGTSEPGAATGDERDQTGVRVGGEGGTVGPGHAAMMTESSGLLDPMIARA